MESETSFEKFDGKEITDDILKEAVELFSKHYGIWGPLAESNLGMFAKAGRRVRMSAERLRQQCLPPKVLTTYVRAVVKGKLVGNVFSCRWKYEGRDICWITQLVVDSEFRRCGLATKLLGYLREGESDWGFGILSSHPAAILAVLRAFGRGPEKVDLSMAREHAFGIMSSSPVGYVREATLRGSLFSDNEKEAAVCCAFTSFWVDHAELLETLRLVGERGVIWPLGDLPEGHEFLILVKGGVVGAERRQGQQTSEL